MNFNMLYVYLTLGVVFATFLDDQLAGVSHKNGRYIRLAVIIFGALSFFNPIGGQAGGNVVAAQTFQTGVSPF